MVHGMLLSRVPSGDVQDLVQDVFRVLVRKLPEPVRKIIGDLDRKSTRLNSSHT